MSTTPEPFSGYSQPQTFQQPVAMPEGADAPEVYERADAPEVYQRVDAPEVCQQAAIKSPGYSSLEAVPPQDRVPQRPHIWKRKRLWFLLAAVVILAAVGIAVGLTVGRRSSSSSSSSPDGTSSGDSSSSNSACHGTVCPQILAAAVQNGLVHVFARGSDNDIWYRSGDGVDWPESWTKLDGGPFASQPSAMSWWPGRLNVFAIAAGDLNVLSNSYSNGSFSYWQNLGESSLSPVGLCVGAGDAETDDRIDPWVVSSSSHAVVHNYYWPEIEDFAHPSEGAAWDDSMSNIESASTPALRCGHSNPYHNLVIYSTDGGSLRYRAWLDTTGWQNWDDWGGDFVSDPVVVSVGADRFDFFGIHTNKAMYHLTWTNSSGATILEKLNGSFESVPSVAITGWDPVRLDVVALGDDDMIKHRALIDSTWTDDWEDLEVFGNSAPLVFQIDTGDSQNRTGLWVVGENNEIYYNSWETSGSESWKGLGSWESMGGDWTTEFLSVS